MSGTMTVKPASAKGAIWWRHSRPESGKPCRSTTGRPFPVTSKSIVAPPLCARMTTPPCPWFLSPVRQSDQRVPVGTERFLLSPIGAELDHLVEHTRSAQNGLRGFEHHDDVEKRPEDVVITRAGPRQRPVHLK